MGAAVKSRCGCLTFLQEMVKLHIKRGDESTFLYETTTEILVEDLITQLVKIFNGILKVQRLCQGLLLLAP